MNTRTRSLFGMALALGAACGGHSASDNASTGTSAATTGGEQVHATPLASSNMAADASVASADAPAAAPQPVSVTAGTPTPIPEGLHPRVTILAPRNNATVRTNRVEVRLQVRDWPAPQDGRHVHLILDDAPYQRIDNPSQPIPLENLAEGTHVLRAFPGWHTHESVKVDGAFAMAVFVVGHPTADFHFDPHAPLLTYSRPKGEYNGADADRILLDFYVHNIPGNQLSANGFRVRYSIDGSTNGEATAWVPYWIEHLPDGSHTMTLDLLGADGQPAAGPFNHTQHTFSVNRSAPTPPPHAMGAAADAGAAAGADAGH
jgi:hypothetical protein